MEAGCIRAQNELEPQLSNALCRRVGYRHSEICDGCFLGGGCEGLSREMECLRFPSCCGRETIVTMLGHDCERWKGRGIGERFVQYWENGSGSLDKEKNRSNNDHD